MLHHKCFARICAGLMAAPFMLSGVMAQDLPSRSAPSESDASGDWDVQVGALAIAGNDYPGAEAIQGMVVPYIDVTWREKYFFDPIRGLGVELAGTDRLGDSLQVGIAYDFGRDEDDSAALTGLGDVDGGPALRVAGQKRFGYVSFGATVLQSLGGDTGLEATVDASTRFPLSDRLTIIPSLEATFGNAERHKAFFGVSPEQAVESQFTAYEPDSGLTSYGVQALGTYDITENFYAISILSYDRLTGEAADSPIVESEDQVFGAFGLVRRF